VGTKKHAQRKRGTAKLELEVGKHYKTRDGQLVKLTSADASDYPFNGHFLGNSISEQVESCWAANGAHWIGETRGEDLIEAVIAPRQPRIVEPQGTFIKIWLSKAGKLSATFHNGRAAADKAKKKDCKLIGVVRHSKRKGLGVVS
jgi:hypothetical protein